MCVHLCMCVYIHIYISENGNLRIHSHKKTLFEIISYYPDCNFLCSEPAMVTGWTKFLIWPEDTVETQAKLLKGTDSAKLVHFKWSYPKRDSNNMGISFRNRAYPSRVTRVSMSSWHEGCLVTHTKWISALYLGLLVVFFPLSRVTLSEKKPTAKTQTRNTHVVPSSWSKDWMIARLLSHSWKLMLLATVGETQG